MTEDFQSAIVEALSDVLLPDELEPALEILRDAHDASCAEYFCFPRRATGARAQRILREPAVVGAITDDRVARSEIAGEAQLVVMLDETPLGSRSSAGLVMARTAVFTRKEIANIGKSAMAFAGAHRRIRRFKSLLGQNAGLVALIERRLGACAALASPQGELLWTSESAKAVLGTEGRALLQRRVATMSETMHEPGQDGVKFVLNFEGKKRLFGEISFVREGPETSVHYLAIELHGAEVESSAEEANLTRSEREVYRLIKQGRSNEQIANARFVALETVRTHVKNILRKTGAKSRLELVARNFNDAKD